MANYTIRVSGSGRIQQGIDATVSVSAGTDPFIGGGATGVQVKSGQSVTFAATGTWIFEASATPYDADGSPFADTDAIYGAANLAVLVGKVGSGGSWFAVGKNNTLVMPATGELYLVLNDIEDAYHDNSGTLSVDINATEVRGDAAYYSTDLWQTATLFGGAGGLNLDGGNIPALQALDFNAAHVYEFVVAGTGAKFGFSFTDGYDAEYSENEGWLKVEVIS